MCRGNACRHLHAARLRRAHQIDTFGGRKLADVQPCPGRFRQPDIPRHGKAFGKSWCGGQPEAGRIIAFTRDSACDHRRIFGMGNNRQIKGRRIAQQPVHDRTAGDGIAAGGGADGASRLAQPYLGEFLPHQAARCGDERMHPDIGLAHCLAERHQRRIIERWPLVGHQHDTGYTSGQARRW